MQCALNRRKSKAAPCLHTGQYGRNLCKRNLIFSRIILCYQVPYYFMPCREKDFSLDLLLLNSKKSISWNSSDKPNSYSTNTIVWLISNHFIVWLRKENCFVQETWQNWRYNQVTYNWKSNSIFFIVQLYCLSPTNPSQTNGNTKSRKIFLSVLVSNEITIDK